MTNIVRTSSLHFTLIHQVLARNLMEDDETADETLPCAEDQCGSVDVLEKIENSCEAVPTNKDNERRDAQVSTIEESERISFRGIDMLRLKVNGMPMFTFHEIMQKISPNSKRGIYNLS